MQLALGLPTLEMDINRMIRNRINTWIDQRTSSEKQIADRANDSLRDVLKLDFDHPLRTALNAYAPTTATPGTTYITGWLELEAASRGTDPSAVNRQLKAATATDIPNSHSLIE